MLIRRRQTRLDKFIGTRAVFHTILSISVLRAWKAHLVKGFFLSAGGFEYPMIIISVCLALIIMGAGKFSIMKRF